MPICIPDILPATTHLEKFYLYFEDVKGQYYDDMIVIGAPVEHLEFKKVDYWSEINMIFEWSKTHVFSSLHICWEYKQDCIQTTMLLNIYHPEKCSASLSMIF